MLIRNCEDSTMSGISPQDPRVRMAAERTLLAWIRTGLAMMGFGFIVARFGMLLRELSINHNQTPSHPGLSMWVGSLLIVLGVLVNLFSAVQHAKAMQRIKRGEELEPERWSMAIVVAVMLAAIGVLMTIYIAVSAQ